MELTIISKNEQSELKRTFGKASILYEGPVPSRKEVVAELSKKASVESDLIIVEKIATSFGKTKAVVTFYLYKDANSKKKILQKYMTKRHQFKEDKKEEASVEEKKTQTTDKKEEASVEEKKE